MTSAFSWQNSISLFPASFHIPKPNLPVAPGVSWLPNFASQSRIMKRTSFCVLVLKGLVGLHKTIQLQLLQHYWLGHRLGLLWYWMVCLGNEQRSLCHFWDYERGWDGWMASLTRWTWIWVTSGSWWWTGWSGVLRFMGSQRVGHSWATELNCIFKKDWFCNFKKYFILISFLWSLNNIMAIQCQKYCFSFL